MTPKYTAELRNWFKYGERGESSNTIVEVLEELPVQAYK